MTPWGFDLRAPTDPPAKSSLRCQFSFQPSASTKLRPRHRSQENFRMPFPASALLQMKAQDYLQLTTNPATNLSFSQWGEDLVLDHLFYVHPPVRDASSPGWYVDFGCFHPLKYSNTMLLSLRGWTGLNVDANPDTIALFNRHRPRDINVHSGIGPENTTGTFYRFANEAASTLSAAQAKTWQQDNGWQLKETSSVQIRTPNSLLAEYVPSDRKIDFLNIDLEGFDRDIVEAIDFDRYQPEVIAVELQYLEIPSVNLDPAVQKLMSHGYTLKSVCMATYIFQKA
jgi:hypothetical protein